MEPQDTKQPTVSDPTKVWPGAFGIYKFSKTAVQRNFGLFFVLWVLYIAAVMVLSVAGGKKGNFLLSILSTAVGVVFVVVLNRAIIAAARGKQVTKDDLFVGNWPLVALKMLGLTLLESLILFVSALLLFVPFFFVYPRIVFAPLYLVDTELGVFGSLKTSWNDTKGNAGKVWGLVGVQALFALLMVTIIGIPFAVYFMIMYGASSAFLYLYVSGHRKSMTAAETSAPASN